jgi:hypothetical protein
MSFLMISKKLCNDSIVKDSNNTIGVHQSLLFHAVQLWTKSNPTLVNPKTPTQSVASLSSFNPFKFIPLSSTNAALKSKAPSRKHEQEIVNGKIVPFESNYWIRISMCCWMLKINFNVANTLVDFFSPR